MDVWPADRLREVSLRIASVESRTYRLPLSEPWMSAKYRITHHELVRTRVVTEDGHSGEGWCTTIGAGGLAIAALVNSYLVPLLKGEDARNHERLWERLWQDLHFAGPGGVSTLAIATIDIAIWDLRAKAVNMPLWRLLGGMRDEIAVYASAVNLHLTLEQLQTQLEQQLSIGYEVFKLKIGRQDFEDDLNRMRAVRQQIGPRRVLLLDVNQRWTAGEAVARCRALAELQPGWIEEPLLSEDIAGHTHVRTAGTLPVAIGEQLGNRFEFWNYVRAEAADYLQPNVWKVGGITEWLKIAHMAQHANLPVAPHNALELSAHLVGAVPNGYMVENIFGGNLSDFGIVDVAPEVSKARVRLDDRPGHGVVFNEAALERFATTDGLVQREQSVHSGL